MRKLLHKKMVVLRIRTNKNALSIVTYQCDQELSSRRQNNTHVTDVWMTRVESLERQDIHYLHIACHELEIVNRNTIFNIRMYATCKGGHQRHIQPRWLHKLATVTGELERQGPTCNSVVCAHIGRQQAAVCACGKTAIMPLHLNWCSFTDTCTNTAKLAAHPRVT